MEATVSSPVSPPVDSQVPMKLVQEMSTSDKFPLDLSEARSALSAPNNLLPTDVSTNIEQDTCGNSEACSTGACAEARVDQLSARPQTGSTHQGEAPEFIVF
ncbi:uncharacterized protein LOC115320100 isoform X4 [Ixodes scapularis]|uniref:uncharacterized protein LOC115320100 isoform X4 n=1 Tax=Ixodes scapularis TaxID=6945 RepID=UPI001A9F0BDD|nr:uncharacterized protein LOC115320100 isoform X4 [Ixodes scapularis]